MSADSYTSIYHLTKNGWEAGATGQYLSKEEEAAVLPPVGRLLTLRYKEFTPYIKTDYTRTVDYITTDRYDDLLRAVSMYGAYPPLSPREAEQYEHDRQLMQVFPGAATRQKMKTV